MERQRVPIVDRQGQSKVHEWSTVALGDVLTLQRGFDLPKAKRKSGSYPVIASTGPVGTHNESMVGGPGVVIGRSGSLGGGQFIEGDFWPLNTTLWVRDYKGNDVRFCYYLLKSIDFTQFNVGSGVPTLNRNHVHPLPVSLPPLAEQRAIAHILGTLDDKIELNRRMNGTLEEMARAIFKDWFIDFGPTRAKMEGRQPYLPAEVWDLFPDSFVDSELGPIPEGWELKPLEELVQLNPAERMKRGTEAPYLNMAALPTSGPNTDDPVQRAFTSGTRFRNGDTLLARITPCLENGKTAYIQALPTETVGWGSTEFIVMRSVPPIPPEYTYLLARDEAFRTHAIQSMTGTSGRQRAQKESLASYRVAFPNECVWDAFAFRVEPLLSRIGMNASESRSLAGLRDTLLPELISGKLTTQSRSLS